MILSAHQPSYIPWLGFFHKMFLSEVFCIFDDVQFSKKDFTSRTLIKSHNGPHWLTVPTLSAGLNKQKIKDVRVADSYWQKKHWQTITQFYNRSTFFPNYEESIAKIFLNQKYKFLEDINLEFIYFFKDFLGINTKLVFAKDHQFIGRKSDLILNMCKVLDSNLYIFGEKGADYADLNEFKNEGIKLYFQKYNFPKYQQIHGQFLPGLSSLDALFNVGPGLRELYLYSNVVNLPNE